jgi:hypothetical protein
MFSIATASTKKGKDHNRLDLEAPNLERVLERIPVPDTQRELAEVAALMAVARRMRNGEL